jgi:5-methylcytosine-specific restriction endonuclease McrA
VRHRSLTPPKITLDRNLAALGKGDRAKLVAYLRERDGNRCQIPGCLYRNRQMGVGLRKPSLDHIIPLTKGGLNELANIQLAHFRCNCSKNNRGMGDQLALIG